MDCCISCFLVLVILFVVAWLMMPFKLNEINRNLEEIKELLREKGKTKSLKNCRVWRVVKGA